ncbi:hypothetical protein [Ornithinicoccus halotolerans]|uniref:hypothetical protein n=1 Tax=Ornithinicoccus halotolerans TaxID=1748220 RepID=UPI001886500A|nr:hypothetical protein [Ornithinicoccus halotolerans]
MMSRFSTGNIIKIVLAVVFFPFVAFLLLIIGVGAKHKRVALEGAVYAFLFSVALALPTGTALDGLSAVLGLSSMGASTVRSYQLRDLWLSRRGSPVPPAATAEQQHMTASVRPSQPQQPALPSRSSADELSRSLAWVTSHAKQNKQRLPADAYVSILETSHTLDAVIDAERQQSLGDARFEYELEAMVREYLPAVLQGYLAIPPNMVEKQQPNGKTPNEELADQLQLLSHQADTLHSNRHRHTSSDLTSTGNFLRERFGHHQRGGFDFGIE